MSKLKNEAGILSRYSLAGALNTVAGFATIFGLTGLGVQPYLANAAGYLVGLVLGFFVSRRFVFRHQGHLTRQGGRYLLVFAACFSLNLLVLRFALQLGWPEMLGQAISTSVYIVAMFLSLRLYVFRHSAG